MTKKTPNSVAVSKDTKGKENKRVCVFLLCSGGAGFPPEFVESYLKARTYFQHTMTGYELVEYFPRFSPNIGAMRSLCAGYMVEGFKKYAQDIAIFLDIDHVLPYDVLVRLLQTELPILCGMYYLKGKPYHPIIYREGPYDALAGYHMAIPMMDYPTDKIFEVFNTGMGCAKIDREVFLKLKPPYFYYRKHSMYDTSDMLDFMIRYEIDNNTEDFPFWEQVRSVGYKIMVDPKIQLGHIGQQIYKEEHWLYYKIKNGLGDQKAEEKKEGE